jgi:hypothetical protein
MLMIITAIIITIISITITVVTISSLTVSDNLPIHGSWSGSAYKSFPYGKSIIQNTFF